MGSSNSKKQAEHRKRMAEKGYSRIPVYAPTNARELIDEIIEVTTKMVEEYEEKHKND
jgi:hypothetical protein